MNSFLFTLTNFRTERNEPFYTFFQPENRFALNLMRKNKINNKTFTLIGYFAGSIILLPYIFVMLPVKGRGKNILVLFPGIFELIILKFLKPIFDFNIYYDTFTSFYLSLVEDRKLFNKNSFAAKLLLKIDKLCIHLSDYQIFETYEMKDYFIKEIKTSPKDYLILKSSRNNIDTSNIKNEKTPYYNITFWGSFEDMHGLVYVVGAAEILQNRKDIRFNLIGDGPLKEEIKELVAAKNLNNVVFFDYLEKDPIKENNLYKKIIEADICLGTFSDSIKNNLVIPGKIVEAMQIGKVVITANTTYMKKYCSNESILINPENSEILAETIIDVLEKEDITKDIGKKANEYYHKEHSPKIFNGKLSEFLTI